MNPLDPEFELIPQRHTLCPVSYQIIVNVLGAEAAHLTLYDDWEVVEIPINPMEFYFHVGDP